MILAFAVIGLIGVLTTDIRWMQLYLLMLSLLFVWELIYILVDAIGSATCAPSYVCLLANRSYARCLCHPLTPQYSALCYVFLLYCCCTVRACQGTSGASNRWSGTSSCAPYSLWSAHRTLLSALVSVTPLRCPPVFRCSLACPLRVVPPPWSVCCVDSESDPQDQLRLGSGVLSEAAE